MRPGDPCFPAVARSPRWSLGRAPGRPVSAGENLALCHQVIAMALAPEADVPNVMGSSGTPDNLAPFPQARAVNRHCGRDLGHPWA